MKDRTLLVTSRVDWVLTRQVSSTENAPASLPVKKMCLLLAVFEYDISVSTSVDNTHVVSH